MSKKVLTLDLTTGQEQLVTQIVDVAPTDGTQSDVSYSVQAVDSQVSAISTAIDGVKAAVLGSSYQNAIKQAVADTAARDALTLVNGDRVLVGNDIHIKTSAGFTIVPAQSGMAFVNLSDGKEYFFDGTSWKDKLGDAVTTLQTAINTVQINLDNKDHNTLKNLQGGTAGEYNHLTNAELTKLQGLAPDSNLVHKTGDETIDGNKTFSKDVIVQGSLSVTGTTTTVDTQNLTIKDNIITLNDAELATHTGITLGTAGFEINRGSDPKATLIFDEADDLFKAGTEGSLKVIAALDDTTSTADTTYSSSKIDAIKLSLENEIKAASPTNTFKAGNPILTGQVVYISGDNTVDVADNTNVAVYNKIAGIAVQDAAKDADVKVARVGIVSGYTGLVSGQTLYLGLTGQLVNSAVGAKVFNIMATAVDATSILLAIDSSILM